MIQNSRYPLAILLTVSAACVSTGNDAVETPSSFKTVADTAIPEPIPLPSDPVLEDYITFGLSNSATIRARFEMWKAALAQTEQADTYPDPQLSYGEFLESVQTRTGPQERRIGLSQAFPWPGKLRAQAQVAASRAEAARHRLQVERLRVQTAIEVAYFDYGLLAQEISTTRELLVLLHGLEPVVQGRIRGGEGQASLLRLQVEIGRLEDDLARVLRRQRVASAHLADAMTLNREPGDILPLPQLPKPVVSTVALDSTLALALENNPEIHDLQAELGARRAAIEVAGFKSLPNFMLGIETMQTGSAIDPLMAGSGDDPLMVKVGVSLPVWRRSYQAAEREARHRVRAAQQNLDALESRLRMRIEVQAFAVEDSARKISLYRDSLIPRASEALQLTLVAYRTGTSSILDLIDSERALLEFQLSFWRACHAYLEGRAHLRALSGGETS